MPSSFFRPKFLDEYHSGTSGMSTLEACIRSLRSAMSIEGRPVYADHRYNFAIDEPFPSEVDDCIGIGREDADYTGAPGPHLVLYVTVPDVQFITRNIPSCVSTPVVKEASSRGMTRYFGPVVSSLWPQEFIDHSIIGMPKYDPAHRPVVLYMQDGVQRVPCITYVIPFSDLNWTVDFNKVRFRRTTIVPPIQYTYDYATAIAEGAPHRSGADVHLCDMLYYTRNLAMANAPESDGDPTDSRWIVSIMMNLANTAAAHLVKKHNIAAVFRTRKDPRTHSRYATSNVRPIYPLNETSNPRFDQVGYTRVTSPARRFEDVLNNENICAAETPGVTPLSAVELNDYLGPIELADRERY